jgi:hypothetical protein
MCLLGHGADRVNELLAIAGKERAVATHAASKVNKMVGIADGT